MATVEKKRWGDHRRLAYLTVGLNSNNALIDLLSDSPPAFLSDHRPRSTDLTTSSTPPSTPATHKYIKRKPTSGTSDTMSSSKSKRRKLPVPPPSYTSSNSHDNEDSNDAYNTGDDTTNEDEEYPFDDDDEDAED